MKNKKILYTALSASLLLAACGTDTGNEDNEKPAVENSDQTEDTGTEGSGAVENGKEDTEGVEDDAANEENATDEDSATDSDSESESESDADSESDTDSSEAGDSAELEGAVETESDEQAFKMQVLPAYELTSEEPGRDILYVKEHEEMYMVIGAMPASETDFDKAVENMTETLAATSDDASPVELTDASQLPVNKDLEKVQAYRVASAQGPITAMIFQRGDLIVRVMMYDNNDEEYYEEYLEMAQTIQAK